MIALEPVTKDNVRAVCELRVVGRAAMALLEDELRAAGWSEREVSFVPVACGFWEGCGFPDTGHVSHGEPVHPKAL